MEPVMPVEPAVRAMVEDIFGRVRLAFQDADVAGNDEASPFRDELVCAICLDSIELAELALIKGCDHVYCAKCILLWATQKEDPWCPKCKTRFNYLHTYRSLDGTLSDFPVEESVTLLKRAQWFQDHLKKLERGKQAVGWRAAEEEHAEWQAQEYAQQLYGARGAGRRDSFDYDDDEDDEVEAFYFSSAAGRARVVIGNRRWGEGGFVSSGRQQARPKLTTPQGSGGKGGRKGKGKGHAATPPPAASAQSSSSAKKAPSPSPVSALTSALPGPSCAQAVPIKASAAVATGAGSGSVGSVGAGGSRSAEGVGGSMGSSPYGTSPFGRSPYGSECDGTPNLGRRARRSAKRAALDNASPCPAPRQVTTGFSIQA